MTTTEKILVGVLVLFAAIFVGYSFTHQQSTSLPQLQGGFVEQAYDNNNDSGSTTTPQFMQTGQASTTMIRYVALAEQMDLNLYYVASSSSSCLQWEEAFSNNYNTTNGGDWYYENATNLSSNVLSQEGASPLLHTWCPGVSATSTKNFTVKPLASKYIQFIFKTTGANASLYAQLVLKNIIQN